MAWLALVAGVAPGVAAADPAPENRVVVHGVLVAQWVAPVGPQGRWVARYTLLPGRESAGQLPPLNGRTPAWFDLRNGQRQLAELSSPAMAQDFQRRKLPALQAEGIFTLNRIVAHGRCPAAGLATLVEADPIQVQVLDAAPAIGCPSA